jgi:glycosyltransferase involved in cell wall biosynthesis
MPFIMDADIGVLLSVSSFKEGISNSIMEYMACELPVVCSDSGGNEEIVVHGETGFIIPSEDVKELTEKLVFLRHNPETSKQMGKKGYNRLVSMCSIERMISEYEVLYTKLLSSAKRKRLDGENPGIEGEKFPKY